jgi:hypothetical protein
VGLRVVGAVGLMGGLCYATVKSFHQATMMESHSIAITESCNIKTCLCNWGMPSSRYSAEHQADDSFTKPS